MNAINQKYFKNIIALIIIITIIIIFYKMFDYEKFEAPTTTQAPTITQAPSTTQTPTTTPFNTIPYNTQYLGTIQRAINNGYTMLNDNRLTIMHNQLRLDNINSRVKKLMNNINKIPQIFENEKKNMNSLIFY